MTRRMSPGHRASDKKLEKGHPSVHSCEPLRRSLSNHTNKSENAAHMAVSSHFRSQNHNIAQAPYIIMSQITCQKQKGLEMECGYS